MQKKHLLTAWILVLALLLTACGASSGNMEKAETQAYDMVTEETVVEESLNYDDGAELTFGTTAMAPEEPKEKGEE